MDITPRLFCGVFPTGLVYADRHRERHGDYLRLAYLAFDSLELKIEPKCPPELAALIRPHAALYQNRRGEKFQISTCGQYVILGYRLRSTPPAESPLTSPHLRPPPPHRSECDTALIQCPLVVRS